jgi:uncharacterized membrane protein YtjA (UPF0391 family)
MPQVLDEGDGPEQEDEICGGPRRASTVARTPSQGEQMIYWAAVFYLLALLAAILGFGGFVPGGWEPARIMFFVFLVVFVVLLLGGVFYRRKV